MNIYKTITLCLASFLVIGCSNKHVQVNTLKPSMMPNKKIYNIVLEDFKKDNINQTNYLEEKLVNHTIEGQNVFNIKNTYKNIDAIITGEIMESSLFYDFYYEEDEDHKICKRYEYINGKRTNRCLSYRFKRIPCEKRDYRVKTKLNVLNSNEELIFSKIYTKTRHIDKCYKNRIYFPHPYYYNHLNVEKDKYQVNSSLAANIASEIINDISPHYIKQYIKIIPKLKDETYGKNIKEEFEKIINLLEEKNISFAQSKLHELNNKVAFKSYEVLYNLALTYEALDNLSRAKDYYQEAKVLCKDEDDLKLINSAIKRTQINLINKIKARSQLPNK